MLGVFWPVNTRFVQVRTCYIILDNIRSCKYMLYLVREG
jgi:hypothetical protein